MPKQGFALSHGNDRPCLMRQVRLQLPKPRPMQKPNTKTHWTLLALCQYYEKFGEAARVRDLYRHMTEIHNGPDHLAAQLSVLGRSDIIDHIVVMSPNSDGSSSKTFAYYPTNISIDRLRDVGLPTELPGGGPIPEDWTVEMPTARVTDEDDVQPPSEETFAPDYSYRSEGSGKSRSEYDTSRREAKPDFVIGGVDENITDGSADEPEPPTTDWDALEPAIVPFEDDPMPVGQEDFDPDMNADPIGDIPDFDPTPVTAGEFSGDVDWNRIATRLERRGMEADEAGLTEMASAYSQFASLAVEGDLDKRTAYILLGTPVLELEDIAVISQS